MNKKAVELPINLMIIAAIGLAVLVVFFITFTSEASDFGKTVLTCDAKGGKCVEKGKCDYQQTNFKCAKKDEICCINPLGG